MAFLQGVLTVPVGCLDLSGGCTRGANARPGHAGAQKTLRPGAVAYPGVLRGEGVPTRGEGGLLRVGDPPSLTKKISPALQGQIHFFFTHFGQNPLTPKIYPLPPYAWGTSPTRGGPPSLTI